MRNYLAVTMEMLRGLSFGDLLTFDHEVRGRPDFSGDAPVVPPSLRSMIHQEIARRKVEGYEPEQSKHSPAVPPLPPMVETDTRPTWGIPDEARLPWRRVLAASGLPPSFVAYPDGDTLRTRYARISKGSEGWQWEVSIDIGLTESGSAESKQHAADRATVAYWRQTFEARKKSK